MNDLLIIAVIAGIISSPILAAALIVIAILHALKENGGKRK